MTNKRGFTLTEILLAIMIVGLIGVALAAVTTAAMRESGTGRTRMILRNQLSVALRLLRQDIQLAWSADVSPTVLTLHFRNDRKVGATVPECLPDTVTYRIVPNPNRDTAPGGIGEIGGRITRMAVYSSCGPAHTDTTTWLENVKTFQNGGSNSTVPYSSFGVVGAGATRGKDARIRVLIIVQSNAFPVANEVIDETFVAPNGAGSCEPCVTNSALCGSVSCN